MALAEGKLPLRKNGQIETRPMHVEEWLETLPYADFQRTASLLHEALAATNKVALKTSVRAELQELYAQPYRYYLQSQIETGARHTLASMESMQQQLRLMKQLAAELARTSQQIINDAGKSQSLWGKPAPLPATQRALAFLSQALIFNFVEYGPTPRHVWQQLHGLFRFAESIDKLHTPVTLPEGGRTTIAHTYCRIVLTELVDPYHLPFGAIWEVYKQVDDWLAKPTLTLFRPVADPAGYFVIDLNSDSPAVPFDRFDQDTAGDSHRLLDARAIDTQAQQALDQLLVGRRPGELQLSANYQRLLLVRMSRAWHRPPKRYFTRSRGSGELPVTCGLKPTHLHMNGGDDCLTRFTDPASGGARGLDVEDEPAMEASQTGNHYELEQWRLINKSHGGCALSRNQRPFHNIRVGDLTGLRLGDPEGAVNWHLGIIRWLMVDSSQHYRMGIQFAGTESRAVALRIRGHGGEPQRGFRIRHNDELFIITARGVINPEQSIEILGTDGNESLQAVRLIEEMPHFEQFSMRQQ